MAKVVVGLSGGVDSSVSALLLKEQGHEVIGLFMKNWEETGSDGVCQSARDYDDVGRVCDKIGIPYYSVNFVEEYWEQVFTAFLEDLRLGYTPNPDVLCNREIKFKVFFEKALSLGADFLATGHYARTEKGLLLKAKDAAKDQSYFLYTLKKEVLERVLFPIGELEKTEVREIARRAGLPVHDKKDSTGICFIGKRDFKSFISRYIPYQPGRFETVEGKPLGQHDGAAYYTIGQRKGLGIGGPGEAWFVVGKDMERNVVILAQGEDHPALYAPALEATEISGEIPNGPYKAKIRYRQQDQACEVFLSETDLLEVRFLEPQRAITPRQSVVFYDGDRCLGGALIRKSLLTPTR